MTGYDYNATYGPLPVHNQGMDGTCWYFAHALALVAAAKMHGVTIGWTDPHVPEFTYSGSHWVATFPDGPHTIDSQGTIDLTDRAAVRAHLDGAGIAPLAISQPASLSQGIWACSSLPVIRPTATDGDDGGHDVVAVGYTADGPIIQNSWGLAYGYQGRAVLSWEWLAQHGRGMDIESYDTYPILGATAAPKPLKETKMLLAQRTPTSPTFSFAGGARFWLRDRAILTAQGLSMADVVVIPGSDPVWRATLLGPVPVGGDV